MIRETTQYSKIYWLIVISSLIIFSGALVFLLVLGAHMRLSGDDYCYNAVLAQKGFWGMQSHSYFRVSMYNGNRYSANLFSGFFGLFPLWGNFLLIIINLLSWLAGLVVILRWVSLRVGLHLSRLETLLIAEAFAAFVLWSAPSLEQSFFWRSGLLSYFVPLVGGTLVLAFVCYSGEKQKQRWPQALFIFLGAVIVGGFSETGAAFWAGFWALSLIFLLIEKWLHKGSLATHYGMLVGSALFGTAVAALLMAISPSTALRLASGPDPMALGGLIRHLAWNVRVYLWLNLIRRSWMMLAPFLFGLGLGYWMLQTRWQINNEKTKSGSIWLLVGSLMLMGGAALILIAAVFLPATFIQSDYPADRTLILSQAVLTGAGILAGILIAVLVDRLFRMARLKLEFWHMLLKAVSLFLIAASLLAPLQIFQVGIEKLPFYSRWSQLWDLRHPKLVAAGQQGVETIHVIVLDHVIEDVGELAEDSGYWYNNCAEMYYGIDEIIADQPGW